MTSSPISRAAENPGTISLRALWFSLGFVLLLWSQLAFASEISPLPEISENGEEAWLVTFGPGELYFERFGHNAIWLREPAAGLDHTFNFGYFDFEQEDFFLRFLALLIPCIRPEKLVTIATRSSTNSCSILFSTF